MYNFIEDMLKEAREDINDMSPWPMGSKMFKVDDESTPLNDTDVDSFHMMTAKVLFACERVRPDI